MNFKDHMLPLTREEVASFLPHRDPMQFIDSVTSLSEDTIEITSEIRASSVFFKGHFPNFPIMPGVLILETLAQTGALLVALSRGLEGGKFIAFSGVDSAKFKRPVFPGDLLNVTVNIQKVRAPYYKFSGKAYKGDVLVASADFSAVEMKFD